MLLRSYREAGTLLCALLLACWTIPSPATGTLVADPLARVCAALVTEVNAHWGMAASAALDADNRFPDDVVQRALWLRGRFEEPLSSRVLPVRVEPRRSDGPFATDRLVMIASGNDQPSLRVAVDHELSTFRYYSVNDSVVGRAPEDFFSSQGAFDLRLRKVFFRPHHSSRLVVAWTAGHVGLGSNSGRVANQLRFMSGVNKKTSLMEPLFDRKNPLWVESAVSAIDIPFHGAGPVRPEYLTLDRSLEFRRRYYESLRMPTPLPLVAAGRSGENLLLAPLAFRHPELFSGMIWVSAMHPTEGYLESMEGFLETGVRAKAPYQPLALHWFLEMHRQSLALPEADRWWEHSRPFEIPVLIIVGSEDAQVSLLTREAFRRMARENPDRYFYVEVPGGGHDVFAVGESFRGEVRQASEADKARAAGAWQYVYWFLKAHVLGDPGVREPELGWRYRP